MSMAVTELYLVRHGETDWNRASRLQGIVDTRLNSTGVSQADQLADWAVRLMVSTVVTSPLLRAQSTARPIARRTRAAFVVDPLLAEIDHGAWTGLTLPTIAEACTDAVIGGQLQFDVGDGETLASAYRRASTVLRRLAASAAPASLVIVSHGVINALLICAAVGRSPEYMNEYSQPNGGTHRLRLRHGALFMVERAPLFDTRHVLVTPDGVV